jgi:hypothetical protein
MGFRSDLWVSQHFILKDDSRRRLRSRNRSQLGAEKLGCSALTSNQGFACAANWPAYPEDVPTKVRKTPRDSAQTRIYTTRRGFLRLPKSDCFQAANFEGLIPTESWSFSSEKSYSPSRLMCCQDTTETFAMAGPHRYSTLRAQGFSERV